MTPGSGLAMQMKRWVLVLARPPPSSLSLAGIWAQGLATFIPSGVPSWTGSTKYGASQSYLTLPFFYASPMNFSTQASYSAFPVYATQLRVFAFSINPSHCLSRAQTRHLDLYLPDSTDWQACGRTRRIDVPKRQAGTLSVMRRRNDSPCPQDWEGGDGREPG